MICAVSADPDRIHTNRLRAESFGSAALAYDRARPSYPPALIDDLLAGGARTALDVGCGTGKAARLLADRGVRVLGVEVDERMADVARSHSIEVEIGGFESWDARGRRFDLIVSGQAWHWIDPDIGAAKAASLLRPGGLLVPFWNFSVLDPDVSRRVDAAYERVEAQLAGSSVIRSGAGPHTVAPQAETMRASGLFASVEIRHYRWDKTYTREQWQALMHTHSDHITLPPERLGALVAAVGEAIDEAGGVAPAHYTTSAVFARVP
jgi:SAM-dependent methyltransferase